LASHDLGNYVAFPGAGAEMMVDDFQISDFADRVKIRWLSERRGEIRLPMDRLAGKFNMARRHAHKPAQAKAWIEVARIVSTEKDDGQPNLRKQKFLNTSYCTYSVACQKSPSTK
jgi:hypothetical protein